MQLVITRQTVAQRKCVRPGDVVDVSPGEARVLKACNKAVELDRAPVLLRAPTQSKPKRKAKP
jgi:hypothetical protein